MKRLQGLRVAEYTSFLISQLRRDFSRSVRFQYGKLCENSVAVYESLCPTTIKTLNKSKILKSKRSNELKFVLRRNFTEKQLFEKMTYARAAVTDKFSSQEINKRPTCSDYFLSAREIYIVGCATSACRRLYIRGVVPLAYCFISRTNSEKRFD